MEKPVSITLPFDVWEALVRLVKAGAKLDTATPAQILSLAARCTLMLDGIRAAASQADAPQNGPIGDDHGGA